MDKSNREYTIHSPFSAQRWPLICTYVKKCAQLDARSGDPFKSNRESPFFMALDSVGACFVFFFLDVRFKVAPFISFKIQVRRTFDDLYCLYFKSEVMV